MIKKIKRIKDWPWYISDFFTIKKQLAKKPDKPKIRLYPVLKDRYGEGGKANGHYFHQDLLVAHRIFRNNPEKHVDIGSRIDGFIAHVASYREIEMFDIRPVNVKSPNITFVQANLMNLDASKKNYTDSISSLHAIEHFGLGRYNDPIDVDGHLKALDNIHLILKPGGTFYFSTPIGKQSIYFNAHRVFNVSYLLDLFKDKYELIQFSYVDDSGDLHTDVNPDNKSADASFGCKFGCGIFELRKL